MSDAKSRCPNGHSVVGTRSPTAWHFYCDECGFTREEPAQTIREPRDRRTRPKPKLGTLTRRAP